MRLRSVIALVVATAAIDASAAPAPAPAPKGPRTLDDYRHFRALAIDLVGRMPTRDEVNEFEKAIETNEYDVLMSLKCRRTFLGLSSAAVVAIR